MRKAKRDSRIVPYAAGLIKAVIITLVGTGGAAALLYFSGTVNGGAGAASVVVMALACFFGGKTTGRIKRHGGIKCGALLGLMYFALLLIPSLLLNMAGGFMLFVKLILCLAFAVAGGIVGVNTEEK